MNENYMWVSVISQCDNQFQPRTISVVFIPSRNTGDIHTAHRKLTSSSKKSVIKDVAVIRCSRSGGLPLNSAAVFRTTVMLFKSRLRPSCVPTTIPVRNTGSCPPLFHDLVQVRSFNWGRDGSINLRPYFVIPSSIFNSVRTAVLSLE